MIRQVSDNFKKDFNENGNGNKIVAILKPFICWRPEVDSKYLEENLNNTRPLISLTLKEALL
jgi:hypothetical protein